MRYAGIGSRQTPKDILQRMEYIGESCARLGYLLRSGGAEGADAAFERGCDKVGGKKEIFLPWPGFNDHPSGLCHPAPRAFKLAEEIIPWWDSLSQGAEKLHARNVHQVLGLRFDEPVDFVVCWTPGGRLQGGTRTAMKIALKHKIPIINLATDPVWRIDQYIKKETADCETPGYCDCPGMGRCPDCGYTDHDKKYQGDHYLCDNKAK